MQLAFASWPVLSGGSHHVWPHFNPFPLFCFFLKTNAVDLVWEGTSEDLVKAHCLGHYFFTFFLVFLFVCFFLGQGGGWCVGRPFIGVLLSHVKLSPTSTSFQGCGGFGRERPVGCYSRFPRSLGHAWLSSWVGLSDSMVKRFAKNHRARDSSPRVQGHYEQAQGPGVES